MLECEHGQLARACNICEYEREIEELKAALAEREKEIEGLKKSYRELENNYVMQGAIYEGISDLLRDGGTSDFMMSFPIVSQIADLLSEISLKQICIDEARRDAKAEIAALKAVLLECRNWLSEYTDADLVSKVEAALQVGKEAKDDI